MTTTLPSAHVTPARADYVSTNRGRVRQSYVLMCPENLVKNALPHLQGVVARPLATPRMQPAAFGEYLLEADAGAGSSGPLGTGFENFLFVLEGSAEIQVGGDSVTLAEQGYCFMPLGETFQFHTPEVSRLLWVKKRYDAVEGVGLPWRVVGSVDEAEHIPEDLVGGSYAALLPSHESFDMAMNVLRIHVGGKFAMIEVHHQEHGLYMLAGSGIYYLGDDHLEVQADDFIYMAPYCPQYFYATGRETASYLLYKDVNRDGF